ncbi:unnamed protein product [Chondrus crispus]|uniref:Uncharacterized protein n=1 Tax=Chondrus crispus TaxID=2769 RepID=R7QDR2_CHOCR|nr:unnamed protein product [Chondrus crispus]CDF35555.1 unnamed protein product [Chondrus crispus]|eukprot:XP_005715374.1 unnamed protein product [Chondrus crispus]
MQTTPSPIARYGTKEYLRELSNQRRSIYCGFDKRPTMEAVVLRL